MKRIVILTIVAALFGVWLDPAQAQVSSPLDIHFRCWPNVIPLPDGHPAADISLTMDRVTFPGIGGWTYGALYLYHGHPKNGEREKYEYSIEVENE